MDWSGSGSSSNEMLNEINILNNVKPPPKYSTTRAQPSNHNDINNIVEGDFHHNSIENIDRSPGSRVQVDDFYYDYNFINFHEDLSDDFDSVGSDSEDGHGFDARQETKPTSNVEGNAHMDTTKPPTATSAISTTSKANADDFEEAVDTTLDNIEDNGNETTRDLENFDDFLSKDSLLPVSTTRSPPLSPTQRSQTQKERDDRLRETFSTMPSVEPTHDAKHGVESRNNEGLFTEKNPPDTVMHRHAAPTPGYQTIINTVVSTAVTALQTQANDGHEFDYKDQTPLSSNIFSEHDGTEGPDFGPQTVTTEVQQDDSASEIPQTTSQSVIFPTALTTESSGNFNTTYVTSQYSWQTDHDLSAVSLPASEKPTPAPLPFLQNSGNQEGSNNSASTGIEIIPPTDLEGATQPLPTDFLPDAGKLKPTDPAFTEKTGTDSSSQGPSLDLADFDYSETISPTMVWSSSNQLPSNTAAPQQSTTLSLHREPLTPPTHPPLLAATSVQTSSSTQVPTVANWVAGNWSAVSLHELSPLMSVSVFYHATHVTFCSHTFNTFSEDTLSHLT